jgi:ribonucleoside-triphosphate reductase
MKHHQFLSFRLSEEFVDSYSTIPVNWGFAIGEGNTLSELTFITKYSRLKEDGSKERWYEVCRRVVEGMFSIQKDHCLHNRIPWNAQKSRRAAEDAYDRMFYFKWTPPGRGLEFMGTAIVNEERSSAPLQNCSFISTEHLSQRNPVSPFVLLMEQSMFGIGVGFDTRGAGKLTIHEPTQETKTHVVEDSREGWAASVGELLKSYFLPNQAAIQFDYSLVRPEGSPLKRFGKTASGPAPLVKLHISLRRQLSNRQGQFISSTDIVDIGNKIGKAVVAGSARRSAEIALGMADDDSFLDLKNWEVNPERMGNDGWGHLSNNTVIAEIGDNLDHIIQKIEMNGEPGVFWPSLAQRYGRMGDPENNKDYRVRGINPCGEQTLENLELCTLTETYPTNHDSLEDFLQTIKIAYLYGKSVTLLPTPWPECNEVMQRNRRIGLSMTGVAAFADSKGWNELRNWCDAAYKVVCRRDVIYSEWLGIRESIKKTTVKPSGTVSLVAATWPGVHWPVAAGQYLRRQRFRATDPMVEIFREAGYHVEADVMDPDFGVVVTFPTTGPEGRSQREVTLWEKMALATLMGKHWSDNAVSATFSFRPDEVNQIGPALRAYEGQLKTMSFLPLGEVGENAYAQMPYEVVSDEEFNDLLSKVKPINWELVYSSGEDAFGDRFCDGDTCVI